MGFAFEHGQAIVMRPDAAREDRIAAQTIAEEIESATGKRPAIVTAAARPAGRVIYLARASDDRALAARLARDQLRQLEAQAGAAKDRLGRDLRRARAAEALIQAGGPRMPEGAGPRPPARETVPPAWRPADAIEGLPDL